MPAARNLRVLVVDEQLSMRSLTRHCLERIGVTQVVDVSNGAKALEVVEAEPFDLIVCDWNLGGINGLELLNSIRRNPSIGRLPFIMATSENARTQVLAAKQAGVNSYVLKPFSVAALRKKIEAVLGPLY